MFDELVKLADDLDELGRHKAVDEIDYLIATAQEVHVDSKGMTWRKVGPVPMPRGHVKWQPERGVAQVIMEGELPETPGTTSGPTPKKAPAPVATQTPQQTPSEKPKAEIDWEGVGKGYRWLKEKGWI